MADELIRLDTTIIGIDSLINKASTAEEANVLFTVKDVIYSQQRYFTDVQPMKRGKWIGDEVIQCSNCNFTLNGASYGRIVHKYFNYCPQCGARMDNS